MAFHYVVREPFGDYAKGQKITDPDEIERLQGESKDAHLIRVAATDSPEPEPSEA